jgi:hypothetical protein
MLDFEVTQTYTRAIIILFCRYVVFFPVPRGLLRLGQAVYL